MMMSQGFYDRVEDFAIKLRQRRVGGSIEAATGTAELLRQLVTSSKVNDPQALIDEVRIVGATLQSAQPAGVLAFGLQALAN